MFDPPKFEPQLTRAEAHCLAGRDVDKSEVAALAAGRAICNGRPSRVHLNTIFEWKTRGRGRSRLLCNSDEEINEALRLAAKAKQPRSAIAVLIGLYGVNVPVASAIATVIHPDRYTIIDFRALHALGHEVADNSLPFYLAYLQYYNTASTSRPDGNFHYDISIALFGNGQKIKVEARFVRN